MGRSRRKKRSPSSPEEAPTRVRLPRQITTEEFGDPSEDMEPPTTLRLPSEITGAPAAPAEDEAAPAEDEPTDIRRFPSQSDVAGAMDASGDEDAPGEATDVRRFPSRSDIIGAANAPADDDHARPRRMASQSEAGDASARPRRTSATRSVPRPPTDFEPTVIRRFSSQSDIPELPDDVPVEDEPSDIRRFFGQDEQIDHVDEADDPETADRDALEDAAASDSAEQADPPEPPTAGPALDMPDDSDDYEGREVWERHTSLSDATAPTLFERINQAQSVLAILRACLPADKGFEDLEAELVEAAENAASLNALPSESAEYKEQSSAIAAALRRIEQTMLERERKVPLSWLRHQADEYDFSESSFAHYLRFQIKYLREAPESWSRIDLVVTRLARKQNEDGTYSIRPPEEVAELWSACLPPSNTEPAVRKAAIEFFELALERLDEINDIEDLFSSGYYIDVLGYKLSLRRDYFDPPVLHAGAKLNIAITNWLEAHQGRNLRALDTQFAEAHAQVRKILRDRKRESSALIRIWSRLFAPKEAKKPEPEKPAARPNEWQRRKQASRTALLRRLVIPAAVLLVLLLGVPTLLGYLDQRKRDLQPLPASEVQAIHPLLTAASLSGESPRLMAGKLDPMAWLELDIEERDREVEALLSALRERGVDNALIYRERILAIHIVGGQVRFVE